MQELVSSIAQLGEYLRNHRSNELGDLFPKAKAQNPWFTEQNMTYCLDNWAQELREEKIALWLNENTISTSPKTVGLIPAGNIPLVGLHDVLCVLASGNNLEVKLSTKDAVLTTAILHYLQSLFPHRIEIVERLNNIDAIIATGSDTTSQYFERYFGHLPHVFRKNRNSIAVINGSETQDELYQLGKDVFTYFGLGCRNVTQLLIPKDYDFNAFFTAIHPYGEIVHHNKYNNNYSYYRTMYLMNTMPFLDNNFLIVRKAEEINSSIGVLHYLEIEEEKIQSYLVENESKIQCLIGKAYLPFGSSQSPTLLDYADGVNILNWLHRL